jgi:hypothetical protein
LQVRLEFKKASKDGDEAAVQQHLALAELQLENLKAQQEHLTKLKAELGYLKN